MQISESKAFMLGLFFTCFHDQIKVNVSTIQLHHLQSLSYPGLIRTTTYIVEIKEKEKYWGNQLKNHFNEKKTNLIARKNGWLECFDVKCWNNNISQCLLQFCTS